MKQAPFRFRVDQQAVTAESQVLTFDIPRQLDLESLLLVLSGSINVTVAYTAVKTQSVFGLVKRVELLANGQTVMEQIGGYELAALTIGQARGIAQGNAAFVTAPGVGVAAQSFALRLPIDRSMFDAVRPKDTNLQTRDLATLQLRVTVGQFSDVFTGAGTGAFTGTTATLWASSVQEYPDQAGRITVSPYLLKRVQQDVPITASNSNLIVRLPIGNLMRRVTFVQRTTADLTTALINNVQLVRGSDVRANMSADFLKEQTASLSKGNGFTGVSVIDFGRRIGQLAKVTDCWALAGAADVQAVLDVTTSGTSPVVSIITEELIPRMQRAA